ncbi:hypothetical protein KGF57_002701 [Candida theae]|uniref:Uncharacterized protein n=1 Tax=Candida theae TaxID=1198502 RepID=A0AAD5BF86_9ASCO|nr:uncharacterized protein KGF57_002701 [Candida theae]KAI5958345.1 hypothetical protein KGF57_002701 [Candida theae]
MAIMRSPSNLQYESSRYQTTSNHDTTYDYINEPIGKVFTDKKFTDPLHDLLIKNQESLSRIKIGLPQATLDNFGQLSIKSKNSFPIFEDEQKHRSGDAPAPRAREGKSHGLTKQHEDKLACHANNILRMAIDSTMMSSMNSITLQNINSDSFDENADSKDNGIISKIEINEDEIRAAING